MAGVRATAQTGEITSGTTKLTLLQIIAAANHRVVVREISVSFKGVSSTASPILVQVLRQTDAGAGGTALTLKKMNESDDESLQTTAQYETSTTEPTGTDEVLGEEVHPQGGYTWQAPFGGEIIVPGGDRLGIAVTAAASVAAKARMIIEE